MSTYTDVLGYRHHSKARSTGTTVILVDAHEQGLAGPNDYRWFTICDEHGGCVGHETLSVARGHMSQPDYWCEFCSGSDRGIQAEATEIAALEEELDSYVPPTCTACGSVYLVVDRCTDCGHKD
jgi:hypothetical protein